MAPQQQLFSLVLETLGSLFGAMISAIFAGVVTPLLSEIVKAFSNALTGTQ